jgi:RNA polymerase sigma-70 factor (ECF subfamily)
MRHESTVELLDLARSGDNSALDRLFARYGPRLKRWAHGRLPHYARSLVDTDDLVQQSLLKTVRNFDRFEVVHADGFNHYLRLTVQNAVRDEIKRARRTPPRELADSSLPSDEQSPLEATIDRLQLRRYELALARLHPDDREAIVARLELGFTHAELAAALGKSTPDAARKACQKAIGRLLALMQDERQGR